MRYQRRLVATGELLGAPGLLPKDLRGLTGDRLADLTGQLGGKYDGLGYVRVPEPVAVPVEIDRLWARLALAGAGLLEAVEAAVAGSDAITQIYWADAARFRRDSPILATVSAGLGLDAAAIDALFLAADQLKAAAGPT